MLPQALMKANDEKAQGEIQSYVRETYTYLGYIHIRPYVCVHIRTYLYWYVCVHKQIIDMVGIFIYRWCAVLSFRYD